MKAYVINLERSPERKIYMQKLLKKFPFLDVEFVTAVDGRAMNENERIHQFDVDKFYARYSVMPRPGEIGCTLSHQKCYCKMVKEGIPCALILEDDIVEPDNITLILEILGRLMSKKEPQIILVSGWFWYYSTTVLSTNYKLAKVYDAFLTHAYLINQAAAQVLVENRPYITADDWRYIRQKGILLQAVLPHLINQQWNGRFVSTVNVEQGNKKSLKWRICNTPHLLFLKMLEVFKHFEKP